ncbi:MAG: pyridoxal 5'-phosphate synthase glutaminase subunit PdxT [Spirochaetales bacterium]|nr:pyridoxal 5'-phosphate synthase glutaminase subunit PdxT [Spirochaetales bacterium]
MLALQGDFAKHADTLSRLGVSYRFVRTASDIEDIAGLIIPGGESSTIGKMLVSTGLLDVVCDKTRKGLPIFGTCAGMIVLARELDQTEQPRLGLMDITVRRNAYGRQIDSFEADIETKIPGIPTLRGVFIRAPKIVNKDPEVETLATFEGDPVLVRQGHLLAASFHPELTTETGVHRFFYENVIYHSP